MTSLNDPAVGDVYVFAVERFGTYGALQVIEVDETRRRGTVAVFDWVGDEPPRSVEVFAGVGWMVRDHFGWRSDPMVQQVSFPVPSEYAPVGTLPVAGAIDCQSYGSWGFAGEVANKLWWDGLPTDLARAYKAAGEGDRVIITPGLVSARTGEAWEVRARAESEFRDGGEYRLTDAFRMESLRSWPCLYRVRLNTWRDDLVPFLEASPLLVELALAGHGQRVLDLSRTHLHRLMIDVTGLERLVLPDSLETLNLGGVATEGLTVEAAKRGRWISLYLPYGNVPNLSGLEDVRSVRVQSIEELAVGGLVRCHPNIRELDLFGAPGVLRDVQALAALPQLEEIFFVDLFGFTAAEFPGPDQLSALRRLELHSTPASVATWARSAFKKVPGIGLSVTKPRKPEWLQENLGNPLRAWDGRDGIPGVAARKASAAWRAALKLTRASDEPAIVAAITDFLEVIRTLNAKHGFIFTLERDEVVEAVHALTENLSEPGRRALDPLVEQALDA